MMTHPLSGGGRITLAANEELTSILEDATQVPEQAEWHTT